MSQSLSQDDDLDTIVISSSERRSKIGSLFSFGGNKKYQDDDSASSIKKRNSWKRVFKLLQKNSIEADVTVTDLIEEGENIHVSLHNHPEEEMIAETLTSIASPIVLRKSANISKRRETITSPSPNFDYTSSSKNQTTLFTVSKRTSTATLQDLQNPKPVRRRTLPSRLFRENERASNLCTSRSSMSSKDGLDIDGIVKKIIHDSKGIAQEGIVGTTPKMIKYSRGYRNIISSTHPLDRKSSEQCDLYEFELLFGKMREWRTAARSKSQKILTLSKCEEDDENAEIDEKDALKKAELKKLNVKLEENEANWWSNTELVKMYEKEWDRVSSLIMDQPKVHVGPSQMAAVLKVADLYWKQGGNEHSVGRRQLRAIQKAAKTLVLKGGTVVDSMPYDEEKLLRRSSSDLPETIKYMFKQPKSEFRIKEDLELLEIE